MVTLAILENTKWRNWDASPVAGDASARRYFRLNHPEHEGVILMLDPPHPGAGTIEFAKIAQHLTGQGLSAPEILWHDATSGSMVITDLGKIDVASFLLDQPLQEKLVYEEITDLLITLQSIDAPTQIPEINHKTAGTMVDLAAIHYCNDPSLAHELCHNVHAIFEAHVDPKPNLALRDFHAENLIWRPHLLGIARIGILDFQDACLAPAGYDLMSLLRDARRDVDPEIAGEMIRRFQSAAGGPNDAQLACIGAQRNLRILGIFARLASEGKPQYLPLIPRVWRQLQIDLAHPALHDLSKFVNQYMPKPEAP